MVVTAETGFLLAAAATRLAAARVASAELQRDEVMRDVSTSSSPLVSSAVTENVAGGIACKICAQRLGGRYSVARSAAGEQDRSRSSSGFDEWHTAGVNMAVQKGTVFLQRLCADP